MVETEGIEKLFFELANEDRLKIIRELSQKNRKMNETARKLNLSTTENFRQFQRLSEAKIIQKLSDGEYTLTQYGKLTLHLIPSLEFTYKHKDYFLNHDIWRLPHSFINRIGELSAASLTTDTIEIVNKAAYMFSEAEKYVWGLGDRALDSVGPAMAQGIASGVKFRFMFHKSQLPQYKPTLSELPAVEKRTLSDIPAVIFCTEKEAAICLHTTDGRMDYTGFFGKDPTFVNWVRELFSFYWDKGARCIP